MNFPHTGRLLDLGDALDELARDQSNWSQITFGNDLKRGPLGALKHLAKEAMEAHEAYRQANLPPLVNSPKVRAEFADCFLLILDASRRAGIPPLQLIRAAQEKMTINKARE